MRPTIWCDNKSAVYMSENLIQHARTKHIKIDLHYVREMVQRGKIQVNHIPGTYQRADILIKTILSLNFTRFRSELNVSSKDEQNIERHKLASANIKDNEKKSLRRSSDSYRNSSEP